LHIDLRHRFTELDLAAFGQQGIILRNADLVTAGNPDLLSITGTLQGQVRDLDLLTLNLDLAYQPELLTINSLQLDSSQIAMNANGLLQLPSRAVQLDWRLSRLEPGDALPQVRLTGVTGTGSLSATANSTPEGAALTATLTRIDGLLNDLPLAISGAVEVADSQLSAVNLQVNSGDNDFNIVGMATEEALAFDWQLQAPQLQQLWQGLDGEAEGQGSVSGTLAMPEFNGQLNGRQLSLQREDGAVHLQSLSVTADASAANNDITLSLKALSLQNSATDTAAQPILEQASVSLAGTLEQHTVNAELALAEANVMLELTGGGSAEGWRGVLQDSSVAGKYGDWQQESAVALAYENDAVAVDEACWTDVLVRLCLQGEKPAGAGFNASLDLRNIPLGWLEATSASANQPLTPKPLALQELQDANGINLPPGLRVEGELDVHVALQNFAEGSWDSLDVTVVPENTVLEVDFAAGLASETVDPAVERFGFTANTLHASNSADLWSAEVDLGIAKQTTVGDVLQGSLAAQASLSGNDELNGKLTFNFDDLGWIETLVPGVSEPYGKFNGSVELSGTKAAPLLSGQVRLADAGFALPDYGLVVSDIDLLLQNLANNAFKLEGSAKSGDGSLAIATTFSNLSSEDRVVTAEITGTDFNVINTGYARANISPQLQLGFANAELTVSGGIILPLLDLDLEAMFATAGPEGVDVSRDAVVLNATEDDAVASDSQTVAVPLQADISLLLGDDVRLRGYGLDTRLNGELSLEQAPNRPVLVYGELGIPEGSFEIYNQVLNAKDGRLMFFGNPANPVVDIRAFRETNDAEVGMLLSGNIKNMQGTLYSSPDLPEDEILALLITGKSFNNINDQDGNALLGAIANFGFERSDGLTSKVSSKLGFDSFTVESGSTLEDSALGLGKYITPDLLMRYKVGLFDRQSVLSIDYNLTKHIKLEVETGISQSVDISYTIETD
jgi:translocation and assembly module TamB